MRAAPLVVRFPWRRDLIHWGLRGWGLLYSPRSFYSVYVCLLTAFKVNKAHVRLTLARYLP